MTRFEQAKDKNPHFLMKINDFLKARDSEKTKSFAIIFCLLVRAVLDLKNDTIMKSEVSMDGEIGPSKDPHTIFLRKMTLCKL